MAKKKAKTTRPTHRSKAAKGAGTATRRMPYHEMDAKELAKATKEFDKVGAIFKGKNPVPRKLLKEWTASERKRGRPPIGEGAQPVQVTIERGLLEKVDIAARDQHTTRSALIARGLEMVLATGKART